MSDKPWYMTAEDGEWYKIEGKRQKTSMRVVFRFPERSNPHAFRRWLTALAVMLDEDDGYAEDHFVLAEVQLDVHTRLVLSDEPSWEVVQQWEKYVNTQLSFFVAADLELARFRKSQEADQ